MFDYLSSYLVRRVAACAVDSNQVMSLEHGPVLKNAALQEGKNIFEAAPQAAGVNTVKAFP